MPRDHKTPLIQKIAKQACITYRIPKSSADVSDTQSELISPVTTVRAADLKIAPRKSKPSSGAPRSPTCTSARRSASCWPAASAATELKLLLLH
ncbi:unnamed protein product [Pleuronectes platessa]|uniref:Uncharacterized protein n=1 Tax=Pleuronectes platessa TaxID=8262 RepID=A0A9N7W3Q8_PLEPL|nr:unnamed protein product [Pleuronectes platessa]